MTAQEQEQPQAFRERLLLTQCEEQFLVLGSSELREPRVRAASVQRLA